VTLLAIGAAISIKCFLNKRGNNQNTSGIVYAHTPTNQEKGVSLLPGDMMDNGGDEEE